MWRNEPVNHANQLFGRKTVYETQCISIVRTVLLKPLCGVRAPIWCVTKEKTDYSCRGEKNIFIQFLLCRRKGVHRSPNTPVSRVAVG